MDEWLEPCLVSRRIEAANELCRLGSHHREERLDQLPYAGHATERQSGRTEPHDLAVGSRLIAPHDVDRVRCRCDVIEGSVQLVESRSARKVIGRAQQAS